MALKITLLLVLVCQALALTHASSDRLTMKPKPFQNISNNHPVVTLFSIHGSNTIGASLGPKLVMSYLKEKGLSNIRVQPSLIENEQIIKGDLIAQGKTIQINIAAHGSSTGFKSLMNGDAQIWASSRPVKDKELLNGFDLRSHESEHILGIDGLAIIVNPKNPLSRLNISQLGKIFSGEGSNWSQLGGEPKQIKVYARDSNSGTWDSFKNMVLGKTVTLVESAVRLESSEELASQVAADSGAIGFIGMAFVGKSKLLAISDGLAQAFTPNEMTVATEDYALSRRLFFYTNKTSNNEYVSEFMDYAQGIAGQRMVKSAGVVSQNIMSMDMVLNPSLPQDYLDMVSGAKSLSINFRFKAGSAKLDNKSKQDILRLVHYLKNRPSSKLMLIGFGDKRKTPERAKLLSKLRAMAVRRELSKFSIYPKSMGYGDFNPVAGQGGFKNRRVEVWLD
jgi:phosphate transport system substrate-binding protein